MFWSSASIISPLLLVATDTAYEGAADLCYYKPVFRFLSIGGN